LSILILQQTGGFVKNFLDSFIVDWTEVLADGHSQWSGRRYHQCVVHDSKIWIIGGEGQGGICFNDVYSSTDGSTWIEVLADGHGQWSKRRVHQCVVHDSKIGGYYLNDVYSSTDGSTWTRVLADGHGQWSKRRYHECVVHDSKLWITGGEGQGGSSLNDVYSSTDGSTWIEVLADGHGQWSKRRMHQCVVHDSKIWIIGGEGQGGSSLNDVYSSTDGSTWIEVLAGVRGVYTSVLFTIPNSG